MDESGRCRRTDGKRWRCSKQVIPNEKYCQTHMHRGCRRPPPSTKLPKSSSSSITTTTTPKHPPNLNLTPSVNALSAAKDTQDDTTGPKNKAETSEVAAPRLKIINQELSSPETVLIQGEECPEEGRRCRRTDGKRWRCTKEVIGENHKYCANHMYRGAKKRYYDYCNPNPYVLLKRDDKLVLGLHTNPSP